MRRKASSFSYLLGLVFFTPLVVFALVSCGANNGSTTVGASSPSPTPPPTSQKCGTIALSPRGTTLDAGAASTAGNCFWQAYQQCRPASFTMTVAGMDTSTTRTFTLAKKNNQCLISEAVQHRVLPRPTSPPQVYTCVSVNKAAGILHFEGCGPDGALAVPVGTK